MATYLGYQILDMTVLNVDEVSRRPNNILSAEFGDDYRVTAFVGLSGIRSGYRFALSAGVWPDDEELTIEGVSVFEYYWEFFNDRIDAGNEPFIIEWRDRYWLVDLAEPNIGVDVHTSDLFTPQGIAVRRRAVPGVTANTDGSLSIDAPEGLTATPIDAESILLEWDAP